ncbi:amidohydrolase [Candidatus Latescibacterota bacterium]
MINSTRRQFIVRAAGATATPYVLTPSRSNGSSVPDIIIHNGKIVTVDRSFSIVEALSIRNGRILATGSSADILATSDRQTRMINLDGNTVVPGLIDAHAHPESASLREIEKALPNPRSVDDCLVWIRDTARELPDGEWITHPKLFLTRLRDLRSPSLAELDAVAPHNPVFLSASYGGVINTAAMRASEISESTTHKGLLRDTSSGKLNGKLINTAFSLLKLPKRKSFTESERIDALGNMLRRYNSVGFTGVTSGSGSPEIVNQYQSLRDNGHLTARVYKNISARISLQGTSLDSIRESVADFSLKTGDGDEWLRIGALKSSIDGGILTGTAFMREPWGEKAAGIFGITDPGYRGNVRVTADDYANFVRAGTEAGWKMTAHCTGGGGVDLMLDGYEQVQRERDIRPRRNSIIHGNFYTPEAISRAGRLGVIADMQAAWFYKDADAMQTVLGGERIRRFHPYRSLLEAGVVVSAGSDHMVIFDEKVSINPYSPWLAMYSMVTRTTERGTVIVPEEAITREQALRCYTINNAFASFEENEKGSIEPGKYADLAVLDRDFLTCPAEEIQNIEIEMTMVGGKTVYRK